MNKALMPHNYRRLGDRVLVTNDAGDHAFFSKAEYQGLLQGKVQKFLRDSCDLNASAEAVLSNSLLSWRGPETHIVSIDGMKLEIARQVVDFIFSTPSPRLSIELKGRNWPVLWFIVQYAERKSEWAKRRVGLTFRVSEKLGAKQALFLREHGVALRLSLELKNRPAGRLGLQGSRALCVVDKTSREPGAWMKWLSAGGEESVRLVPAESLRDEKGLKHFLEFYAVALDVMGSLSLRDEWSQAFLEKRPWALPGTDVLAELAYDGSGRVFTSEGGLDLGSVESLRYQELGQKEVVKACVTAASSQNQPLCFQCVYKPYCTVSPAGNLKTQGSVWGQTPSSFLCGLHMGILDVVFSRLWPGY